MSSANNLNEEEYLDDAEGEGEQDLAVRDPNKGITAKKGYATPGRRSKQDEAEEEEGSFIQRPFGTLRDYFEGVIAEGQKVLWPTREDARHLTVIVLLTMILAAIVLGVVSFLFSKLFELGLNSPLIFGVLFVIVVGAYLYYLRNSNRSTASY